MMTALTTRKPVPRKPPQKRLFSGMAGSPLARVEETQAPEIVPQSAQAPVAVMELEPKPEIPPAANPVVVSVTVEEIAPPVPKKLGRPPKHGTAMTVAERKAASRAKQKEKLDDAERRKIIVELMKIYDRQALDVIVRGRGKNAEENADKRREIDRQQKRSYLGILKTLTLEQLQLVLETKKATPDTHGQLPGERSGEKDRKHGQSEIEIIDAARQHNAANFEGREQDPQLAGGFKTKPEGAGPASFDRKDSTVDSVDRPTARGRRVSAKTLERQQKNNEKMEQLVLETFDELGYCHVPERYAISSGHCYVPPPPHQRNFAPCSFRAKNANEALEHLWTELYAGEKLWTHVDRLADVQEQAREEDKHIFADTVAGPLLAEARRTAHAHGHHYVITEWFASYRKSWKKGEFRDIVFKTD